jgi:ABC-type glycerol-3-phosphate transport system permease component
MTLSQSLKELPYQHPLVSMQRETHEPPSLHGTTNSYATVIVQIVVTFTVALIVGYVLGQASFPQRQDGFLCEALTQG